MAVIVGTGHTKFGNLEGETLEDLIVAAGTEALADAGIAASEVDAAYLAHFNAGMVPDSFASSLIHQISDDLRFTPVSRCENACASGAAAISAAINAIASGKAEVVLIVGAEKMTAGTTEEVTRALGSAGYSGDAAEAALSFPQVFGNVAAAYGAKYSDPLPAMAAIAAKNHHNAMGNPLAHMRREFSVEDCSTVTNRNPVIAAPLRLTDCSLISDGAAALVLVSKDRAQDFARRVGFRAFEHVSDFLPIRKRDFLAYEGPERAIRGALVGAGIGLDDLSFAEVHDCFTIAELLIYEAMGLAEKGQGHRVLENGDVFRGGRLPVNLSGGLKAKGHPVGATGVSMHALAFRQLTGTAGDIQCEGAELGLVFNMGGAAVANYASVLEIAG
ncbi:MAG: thiolase domain-containing protein [Paracoccaceae bacterium]